MDFRIELAFEAEDEPTARSTVHRILYNLDQIAATKDPTLIPPVQCALVDGFTNRPLGDRDEEIEHRYDVTLCGVADSHTIQVIKEVRAHSSCGLKEAKDLVDNVRHNGIEAPLVQNVPPTMAMKVKERFEGVGGTVNLYRTHLTRAEVETAKSGLIEIHDSLTKNSGV